MIYWSAFAVLNGSIAKGFLNLFILPKEGKDIFHPQSKCIKEIQICVMNMPLLIQIQKIQNFCHEYDFHFIS